MNYPNDDRDLANEGVVHWAEGLDDDNQLHLASGETLDWIEELKKEYAASSLDFFYGNTSVEVVQNMAHELGQLIARLSGLYQRMNEFVLLVQEKSKNE